MTAQDLLDEADKAVEAIIAAEEASTKEGYISTRRAILSAVRDLWAAAAVEPTLDPAVGNTVYVSKAEAYKYGRYKRLEEEVIAEIASRSREDATGLEAMGSKVYQEQYNGYAWAYQQGYELPIIGGAKVKMVAAAVYSDFYGAAMDETVRKNLGAYAQQILETTVRALNQGSSYQKIAADITQVTDRAYNNALRVARTEGGRIQAQAFVDGVEMLMASGATATKMWHATIDDRTREGHQEMDGNLADADGIFHLPSGATGPAPHLTGNAGDDINCRCTAVVLIDGVKPSERRVRGEGLVPYETYKERLARGGEIPVRDVRAARPKV